MFNIYPSCFIVINIVSKVHSAIYCAQKVQNALHSACINVHTVGALDYVPMCIIWCATYVGKVVQYCTHNVVHSGLSNGAHSVHIVSAQI